MEPVKIPLMSCWMVLRTGQAWADARSGQLGFTEVTSVNPP